MLKIWTLTEVWWVLMRTMGVVNMAKVKKSLYRRINFFFSTRLAVVLSISYVSICVYNQKWFLGINIDDVIDFQLLYSFVCMIFVAINAFAVRSRQEYIRDVIWDVIFLGIALIFTAWLYQWVSDNYKNKDLNFELWRILIQAIVLAIVDFIVSLINGAGKLEESTYIRGKTQH